MKTIKIAHLYYDLMNLYGEVGNITAIKSALDNQGVKYSVDLLTKGDNFKLAKYDIIYMGCGTEKNQEIVRNDILKYQKQFLEVINTKTIIMTGNAFELLGKVKDDKECLNIFPFESYSIPERDVSEVIAKTYFLKNPIIGFQNRGSINNNQENHFLDISKGFGDNEKSNFNGIHINNFYATDLIGPLLIRNPYLTNYIIENLFNELGIPYKDIPNTPEIDAYNEFIAKNKIAS